MTKNQLHPNSGEGLDLGFRFSRHLMGEGVLAPGDRLVVALSGGVDSTVLLHLLRFTPSLSSFTLVAAHFDHRMRPESQEDRGWVAGLCRAWEIPLHSGTADPPPDSEEEARDGRYRFLEAVGSGGGGASAGTGVSEEKPAWILTGHHGDDQAETVLFRVLRGTGLRGLAGIPTQRSPQVYRPLLPFSREDLLAYASAQGLRFRRDSSNQDLTYSRNFLRHKILPAVQAGPAPGAKEALRRLARLARENEDAWESLLPNLLNGVLEEEGNEVFIVRAGLLAHHPTIQTRLLREILQRSGIELDEAGTRAAVEFTKSGASGRALTLPGDVLLTRDFHRFRVGRVKRSGEDLPLFLSEPSDGRGDFTIGGCCFQAVWGLEEPGKGQAFRCPTTVEIPLLGLEFPLMIRGWLPGDRIELSYGTKKLKKLFAEERVPVDQRGGIPVLQDSAGRVLWVPGFSSSALKQVQKGSASLFLGIRNVDES